MGVRPGISFTIAAGRGSSHHGGTTAAFAGAPCKTSAVSGSQQLRKPIHQGTVRTTWKDRAQHYERKRLEFSERKKWKVKGPNSEKEKEKKSIDRKGAFAGKVEGTYTGKEEGFFQEEGEQSVKYGGLSKTVMTLMGGGLNLKYEWK